LAGRKTFTAGEVLQAADVNDFLMDQSVMVFAGTAARGSAIPSPTEGMVTYLQDSDAVQVYKTDWEDVGVQPSILQVVSTTKTDTFTTTSTSFTDVTDFTVSITPSSASSKVFLTVTIGALDASADRILIGQVLRDSTAIGIGDTAGSRPRAGFIVIPPGSTRAHNAVWSFVDSPSTTSAITYKLQVAGTSAGTLYFNRTANDADSATFPRSVSSITAMEVAG